MPDYETLVLTHPGIAARCRNVALDYFRFRNKTVHRNYRPTVIWIYGGTGIGKSRLAVAYAEHVAGSDYWFHKAKSLLWWDGYEGQKCVIIDDFRRRKLVDAGGFSYLLRLLDRYDMEVEIKGGFRKVQWTHVVITGPRDPVTEFTYRGNDGSEVIEEDLGQLVRRLERVVELRAIGGVVSEIDHTGSLRSRFPSGEGLGGLRRSQVFGLDLGGEPVVPEPEHGDSGSVSGVN